MDLQEKWRRNNPKGIGLFLSPFGIITQIYDPTEN